MFESLLKLIDRDSNKTPLEDFTTEILTGILRSDQKIMDYYVNKVLGVVGSNFELETQVIYEEGSGNKSRPDMIFSNEDTLIFQENKVESKEGYNQLSKYKDILSGEEKKNKYLRYCTKYYNKKEVPGVDFKQLRWMDIYRYLEKNTDNNQLIKYFMEFLKEKNMALPEKFTAEDIETLSSLVEIISKTNEALDQGKGILKESFKGTVSDCTTKKLVEYEGIYIGVKNVLPGGACELNLGINYGGAWELEEPNISIHLYIVAEHDKYKEVKKYFSKLKDGKSKIEEYDDFIEIYYQEALKSFISDTGNDIMSWYEEHIKLFYSHCKKSNLDWNIV